MADSIHEGFEVLQKYFRCSGRPEYITNLPQLVIFAEQAVQNGACDIAVESVELYLSLEPPSNQFLIRAHLCLSTAHKPHSPAETIKLQKCCKHIVKAINLAKKTSGYHFLVYNASVVLWDVTRPLHTPQYYPLYANCLQSVVKALEETHCRDYQWRLQLMRLLMKCQVSGGQREEVGRTVTSALQLARKHAPNELIPLYKQAVREGIVGDAKVIEKELKKHPELSVLSRLWRLQSVLLKKSSVPAEIESKLLKLINPVTDGEATPSKQSGRSSTPPTKPLPPAAVLSVLIEIAETAINYSFHKVTSTCVTHLTAEVPKELQLRKRLLDVQLRVANDQNEVYSTKGVKVRCECVDVCKEMLLECTRGLEREREGEEDVECVCVVIWNIVRPLLQGTLVGRIVDTLLLAAHTLERINSLMYGLRCQLHFELAKAYNNADKSTSALSHIDKAMSLDHQSVSSDCLGLLRTRILSRNDLYTDHTHPLDQAMAIIEQVKATDTSEGLHQLLVSVGTLLDPTHFLSTLVHETPIDSSSLEEQDLLLHKLSAKCEHYNKYKETAIAAHTEEERDTRTRCLVWGDVAKLARTHHLWDIALLSSLYCLQYDNGHWTLPPVTAPSPKDNSTTTRSVASDKLVLQGNSDGSLSSLKTPDHTHSLTTPTPPSQSIDMSVDKLLLVTLGEVHCVLGECLVNTLNEEGVQLGGVAIPQRGVANTDNPLWTVYSDWIVQLTGDAHKSFLRSVEVGVAISEHWMVSNAVVYLWNYHITDLREGKWAGLTECYKGLLQVLRAQPMATRDNALMCRVAGVLAMSLLQGSVPKPSDKKATPPQDTKKGGGRSSAGKGKKKREGSAQLVPQDKVPLVKEALEVCEFACECFQTTPFNIRRVVLEGLVTCKQLLQQSLNYKTSWNEDDPWLVHCQAVTGVLMYRAMTLFGIYEFPSCPSIQEVQDLVSGCDWRGYPYLQTELYTLLAQSAHKRHDYIAACECCDRAISVELPASCDDNKRLLSMCHALYGQSLCARATSDRNTMATVTKAIYCFDKSISYGEGCDDIMLTCRHAWNAMLPILATPTNRAGLKGPGVTIISNVLKILGRNDGECNDDDHQMCTDMINGILRIYSDSECEWGGGLEVVEQLLRLAPKSFHRTLYTLKIFFKSKLGRSVEGEIIRFQEESPLVVGSLWFTCAQESCNTAHRLVAYQRAIQAIQQTDESRLLVNYAIEYSLWLNHTHQYPPTLVIEQLKWAGHMLSKDHTHLNASQLDSLLVIHVMMSLMSIDQSKEQLSLSAVGYCYNLWKAIYKQGEEMPDSMDGWMCFSLSNEILELIASQNALPTGDPSINEYLPSCHTLQDPLVTLYYLDQLYNVLYTYGQYTLILPVLFYQLLLVTTCTDEDKLTAQLINLRLSHLLSCLVDSDSTLATDYYNKAVTNESSSGFIHPSSVIKAQCSHVTCGHVMDVQSVWIKIADLMILQGQLQSARNLLQVSQDNNPNSSQLTSVQLLLAKLDALEGRHIDSVERVIQLKDSIDSINDWTLLLDTLCIVGSADSGSGRGIVRFLTGLLEDKSCDQSCDHWYLRGVVLMRLLKVSNCLDERWEKYIDVTVERLECYGHYKLAIALLQSITNLRLSGDISTNSLLLAVANGRQAVKIVQSRIQQCADSISSTLFRDLVECQLSLSTALLSVYQSSVSRRVTTITGEQQQPSIRKLIHQFTVEPSLLTEQEQLLTQTELSATDEALSMLTTSLTLINTTQLKAKCLLYIGLFMYYKAVGVAPDHLLQWTTPTATPTHDKLYSTLSMVMRKEQAGHATIMESVAIDHMSNACNILTECVAVGVANSQLDIVSEAAMKLVLLYGQCNPLLTTTYLLLYQSCVVAMRCREVLVQVLGHPNSCKLAALLNQESLLKSHDQHMTVTGDVNTRHLQKDHEAYRRLQVSSKHTELIQLVHCDTRVILLQHSEDMNTVFAGYIVPPQPPPPSNKKGQSLDKPPLLPAVCMGSVCHSDLIAITELYTQYTTDIRHHTQRQHDDGGGDEELQTMFDSLVCSVEAYLHSVLPTLANALSKEDPSKELTIVLLADHQLLQLPLEALGLLREDKRIVGVSRDLSLQMVAYRMLSMKEAANPGGEDAAEQSKKKPDKYQPQPDSFLVNTSAVKYVLDPRDDLRMVEGLKKVIQDFPKVTAKWTGLLGANQIISPKELYSSLSAANGATIIVCSELFLNHYPPHSLASTNIPNCSCVILEDKMSTDLSYHTQCKQDLTKQVEDKRWEDGWTAVVLLSLVGVNCVVTNQWYSTPSEGTQSCERLLQGLLSNSTRTGQVLWSSMAAAGGYKTLNKVVYGLPHLTFNT